jgi:hypothetical protein
MVYLVDHKEYLQAFKTFWVVEMTWSKPYIAPRNRSWRSHTLKTDVLIYVVSMSLWRSYNSAGASAHISVLVTVLHRIRDFSLSSRRTKILRCSCHCRDGSDDDSST